MGLKDRNRILIGGEGGDWESIAVATNPKFLAIVERSRKSRKPGLSTQEMRRRLTLKRRAG